MDWIKITLVVPIDSLQKAQDIATMTVPYGFYTEDYSDLLEGVKKTAHVDLIDEELLHKDKSVAAIHIFIPKDENPNEAVFFIKERLKKENIEFEINTDVCKTADWENNWKKYFKPFPVGEKLYVRPSWINDFEPDERIVINIEPGSAFGSGTHESTALCLKYLEKVVRPFMSVLDIGCGSGILGIASLLLGARKLLGIDIDSLSVETSADNAKRNGFDNTKAKFMCGNLTQGITEKYDLILANIVADAIIDLSFKVPDLLTDDGVFIASGIIDTREKDVVDVFSKNRLEIISRSEENGWIAFECKKSIRD